MSRISSPLQQLELALQTGQDTARWANIAAWVERHLDASGIPRELSLQDWKRSLLNLVASTPLRALPEALRESLSASIVQLLRRTRPDGTLFFEQSADAKQSLADSGQLIRWTENPALVTVLNWWKPRGATESFAPPPLPSDHRDGLVSSVLRPDWTRKGCWIGVDHRSRGDASAFELGIAGAPLLGPVWRSTSATAGRSRPTLLHAKSGPFGDIAEWSITVGGIRRTRTAVLLRGRDMALVSEQVDGGQGSARSLRLSIDPAWRIEQPGPLGALALHRPGQPKPVQALPLAGSRGQVLSVEGSDVCLMDEQAQGSRSWLPLLVCWGKAPQVWKPLTVSEKSKICPSHIAFGARLAWGPHDESLLIYRSHTQPALRAVLGLQTKAKFLIGRFTKDGRVIPLVSTDG